MFLAALNLEPEVPDYDMDSEDETWLASTNERRKAWSLVASEEESAPEISPDQFEMIVDRYVK